MLSDTASIQIRQAAGHRLRILIPALFLPTAITGVTVAVRGADTPSSWLRWAAVFCLAIWIATRVLVTVPVNSAVLDWPAASPPTDWKDQVRRAQRVHILGVWASLLAFVCLLAADLLMLARTAD